MGRVIEVRLLHPETGEIFTDKMALVTTPYSARDHTPAHMQGIQITLDAWIGDLMSVKELTRTQNATRTGSGTTVAWGYVYEVILQDKEPGREEGWLLAQIFDQYKEKATENGEKKSP